VLESYPLLLLLTLLTPPPLSPTTLRWAHPVHARLPLHSLQLETGYHDAWGVGGEASDEGSGPVKLRLHGSSWDSHDDSDAGKHVGVIVG